MWWQAPIHSSPATIEPFILRQLERGSLRRARSMARASCKAPFGWTHRPVEWTRAATDGPWFPTGLVVRAEFWRCQVGFETRHSDTHHISPR
jgi:hypothetical protein